MKETTIYIIWNNSFTYGDLCIDSAVVYITEDYELAKQKFEQYKKLCKDTYGDPKWCYSYSLVSYILDSYPIKEKCLCKIDNISDD